MRLPTQNSSTKGFNPPLPEESRQSFSWQRRERELILKSLVEKQAAYLLVSLRQRMLAVPDNPCRRIVNIPDPAQARRILKEAMLSLLSELRDLPQAVTDPNWPETLEADEGSDS
jgi:hypothetical protein